MSEEAFDPEALCNDCGSVPKHVDDSMYCRRCAESNGYRYKFFIELDRDIVRREFGEAMLKKLEELAE